MSKLSKSVEAAIEAIDEVFGDTSVSQQETLDALQDISSALEAKIKALKIDMKRAHQ